MQKFDSAPSKDQWAILSALRFFLALTVVLGHFSLFVRLDQHHIFGDGYLNPGSAVFGFFIISGFSIAASVSRETDGFYGRRFVRIWPLYLATIALGLALAMWMPAGITLPRGNPIPPTTALTAISPLLMLQTIATGPLPMAGPIWSLSVPRGLFLRALSASHAVVCDRAALAAKHSARQLGPAFLIPLVAVYAVDYSARRILKWKRQTPHWSHSRTLAGLN